MSLNRCSRRHGLCCMLHYYSGTNSLNPSAMYVYLTYCFLPKDPSFQNSKAKSCVAAVKRLPVLRLPTKCTLNSLKEKKRNMCYFHVFDVILAPKWFFLSGYMYVYCLSQYILRAEWFKRTTKIPNRQCHILIFLHHVWRNWSKIKFTATKQFFFQSYLQTFLELIMVK